MTNLILCGGVGSRLWPLSRTKLPKQFARMLPGESLFEATVKRNRTICDRVLIASNEEQSQLAAIQLRNQRIDDWFSLVEPMGRNTAPAIALSCHLVEPDEILLVTPSDHVIVDNEAYADAVVKAKLLAEQGRIVTFGIKPEYPETGFGYIENDPVEPEKVLSFKEKPDYVTAQHYLEAGNYLWNSGMFCFKASVFLSELEKHAPDISRTVRHAVATTSISKHFKPGLAEMKAIPSISVDYAVLEKSSLVNVVPCSIGWSDLGSFDALYDHLYGGVGRDDDANVFSCLEDPVIVDSRRNLVINGERLVALIDVDDLIVVESEDALLVAKRGSSQKVKHVVDRLKERGSRLVERFLQVDMSWGSVRILSSTDVYAVLQIELLPTMTFPPVFSEDFSRRFVVLKGAVELTADGKKQTLIEGGAIELARGVSCVFANESSETVVLIETRTGNSISLSTFV